MTEARDGRAVGNPHLAPSLRNRLTRLVLACLLPFVVLALMLAGLSYGWNKERAVTRTADVARGIALAVERELRVMTASMEALSFSPSLAARNLEAFRGEADALIARHFPGAWITLLDPSGQQLLNTLLPPGTPLPRTAAADTARQVFETGQPAVSDLFQGAVRRVPVIAVVVPVRDTGGRVTQVLALSPPLSVFNEILHAQRPLPGWVVSIFDRAGVNVARTPNPERFVGVAAAPSLRPLLLGSDEGQAETTSLEGTPLVVAWNRPGPSGWSVGIGIPRAELNAPLWRSLGIAVALSSLVLLGGLLLARFLASRIARPITALVGLAQRGNARPVGSLGLREADEVAAALATAETRRVTSEAQLSRIFEAAHDHAIIVLDLAGRITAWNPGAEKLFGWTAAEILGRDAAIFFTPEDRATAVPEAEMRGARERGRALDERWHLRSDESRFWAAGSMVPLHAPGGTLEGYVKICRDETTRQVTEAALRRSEATLNAVLDGLPVGVIIADASGRIVRDNAANRVLWGAPPETTRWEDYGEWVGWWPDTGERIEAADWAMTRALRHGEVVRGELVEAQRFGSEERRLFLNSAAPVRDAEGHIIAGVVAQLDVTDLRQADQALARSEAELRRLNEELEARVREEIAAREQAQATLAQGQRLEALGQLAGGIAHDFNNVLQAVQGGARLIEGRPADADRVRRLAMMIAEAAARGASVTRRLLAFSRRADLRAEPVDAAELLGDMREILAHTLGTGIEVRIQALPNLPALLADKSQLETVLVNLATNARDAMGGAGTIILAAAAETVAECGGAPGGGPQDGGKLKAGRYVRLSVSDTGIGMDAPTLARATEPFFTTKASGEGTGLGLAMARGFAEQSAGALAIESAPGRGTTIRLWFPAAHGILAASRPLAETRPAGDSRRRIMLVDDEALVRAITAEGLEASGHAVQCFASAAEALEALEAGEVVDLLVSDLSMPAMDGVALIREAQRRRPRLPAILLTGFATDAAELALGGVVGGSFSLLRKPIESQALAERIAVLLEGVGAAFKGDDAPAA